MNKSIMMGRVVKDPDLRYTQTENGELAIANFRLAVDRKFVRRGDPEADFFSCTAFGRKAEFAEKYFRQGMRVSISGRIQTGSYTNRDGQKVYTTDIVVEEQEFAESKTTAAGNGGQGNYSRPSSAPSNANGFMTIPDNIDDELPFV